MTLNQFKHDMIRGLGTCQITLHESNDIEIYRPIILYGLLNVISYEHVIEGTRSHYIYQLIKHFHDDEHFLSKVIHKLENTKRSNHLKITLIERLREFAIDGYQVAITTLYDHYHMLIHKKKIGKSDYIVLDYLCVALFHVQKMKFLNHHIKSMKALRKPLDQNYLGWFHFVVINTFKDKGINKFKEIYPDIETEPQYNFIQEGFTLDNLLMHINDEDFSEQYIAFYKRASMEEIHKTIDYIIQSKDEYTIIKLLDLISHREGFDYKIHEILNMIDRHNDQVKYAIYEYCCYVKNDQVKKLGYSLLKHSSTRSYGIRMLIINYQNADNQVIIKQTKKIRVDYNNTQKWHEVFGDVIIFLDENHKQAPYELLEYMFNETLTSIHRDWIFDVLKKRKMLTKEILEVYQYDSDADVSSKAHKLLNKKKQVDL